MKFYKVKDMETMVVAINDNGEKVALIVRADEAVEKEVVFAACKNNVPDEWIVISNDNYDIDRVFDTKSEAKEYVRVNY